MADGWHDWPEAVQLRANLHLLLQRPNGRKIAAHLVEHTAALLDYKANRKGSWQKR